jgi:hypothetical protein
MEVSRYLSKGKQSDKGHCLTPSWGPHVTKTFVKLRDGIGAWQTTSVMSMEGPESSTIAADYRDKHHELKIRSVPEGPVASPIG